MSDKMRARVRECHDNPKPDVNDGNVNNTLSDNWETPTHDGGSFLFYEFDGAHARDTARAFASLADAVVRDDDRYMERRITKEFPTPLPTESRDFPSLATVVADITPLRVAHTLAYMRRVVHVLEAKGWTGTTDETVDIDALTDGLDMYRGVIDERIPPARLALALGDAHNGGL